VTVVVVGSSLPLAVRAAGELPQRASSSRSRSADAASARRDAFSTLSGVPPPHYRARGLVAEGSCAEVWRPWWKRRRAAGCAGHTHRRARCPCPAARCVHRAANVRHIVEAPPRDGEHPGMTAREPARRIRSMASRRAPYPLRGIQRVVANRTLAGIQSTAHVTAMAEVDAERGPGTRPRAARGDPGLTLTHLLIKAAAPACADTRASTQRSRNKR